MDLVLITKEQQLYEELEKDLTLWGYRVIWGKTQREALFLLSSGGAPVLALIDENIDSESGLYIVRSLRRRSQAPYQYLIILGESDGKKELRAMLFGADSFLSKPIDRNVMRVQVHVARRIMSKHLQVRQRQEELWNQANIDPLTGIPNRRAIFKSLEKNVMLCSQYEQPLGIMMIDLDHFKDINDGFGHDGGDLVLQEVSRRMQECIRTSDVIGRFGGEEFLAIIPNGTVEELKSIAERIRESLHSSPVITEDFVIPVTCSIGVAVLLDYQEEQI
jgi:diguanylate cyclase (GGDEF)-like protein